MPAMRKVPLYREAHLWTLVRRYGAPGRWINIVHVLSTSFLEGPRSRCLERRKVGSWHAQVVARKAGLLHVRTRVGIVVTLVKWELLRTNK
jgi:hypothetical protein